MTAPEANPPVEANASVTASMLDACSHEPIHIPGAIQAHGMLLTIRTADQVVLQVSATCADWLGLEPDALLGSPLGNTLPELAAAISSAEHGAAVVSVAGRALQLSLMVREGLLLIELEPADRWDATAMAALREAPDLLRAVTLATDTTAACVAAADGVQRLSGYDRVMIYRFDEEGNGEVVAESVNPGVPAFLGQHYPAADIPLQARAMMLATRVRLISDSGGQPIPLLPRDNPLDGKPLDLGICSLRAVSPIHLEYLRNMEVGGSLTAAIIIGERLWGLIACHHLTPCYSPRWLRSQAEAVAHALAGALAAGDRARHLRAQVEADRLQRDLLSGLTIDGTADWTAELMHNPRLLDALGASGAVLAYQGATLVSGVVPGERVVDRILEWLRSRMESALFDTDSFRGVLPVLPADATACGMLALRVELGKPHLLVWFRPEQVRTVIWAGDPTKSPHAGRTTDGRLNPRTSFAAWQEQVEGRSRAWSVEERQAATAIGANLRQVVGRIFGMQQALARSNRELTAFAHAAVHDLQEPLRTVASSCVIMRKHIGRIADGLDENTRRPLLEFMGLAEDGAYRGQELIKDLLEFAQIGAENRPADRVSLAKVCEEALTALRSAVEESGAVIEIGPMPAVQGHRRQLIQLIQNLVGNAVKYRGDQPPRITISSRRRADAWEISVVDNGIGIEPRYHDAVFVIFKRLHGKAKYPGTGVGLALCRKVVEQHGGRIWIESQSGAGSVFRFTITDLHEAAEAAVGVSA